MFSKYIMDFIKPFIIGGSVISGAKLISKLVHPSFAPIVGGMPTGLIAVFFLDTDKEKKDYFSGYVYSATILAITIFICNWLVSYKNISANVVSITGLILWGIVSYFIINKFVANKKK